jgi:hypothetical protein
MLRVTLDTLDRWKEANNQFDLDKLKFKDLNENHSSLMQEVSRLLEKNPFGVNR